MRSLSPQLASIVLAATLVAGGILPQAASRAGHAAAAAVPVRGGTAIDGLYEEPISLLPNSGFLAFSIMVQETLFSPLFYTDGTGALHPGLAAAIPTVANGGIGRDGLTYTFRLRPNLVWSDGKPLDARDVDYSWRTWLSKDLVVNSTTGFDRIRSATVSVDNLSIIFHLSAPYAPFVAAWTDQVAPLPAHVLSTLTPKQINTSKFVFAPSVSSGPFVLTARQSSQSITEARNPHYYQPGRPYLDRLIFRIIPDQVALTNALAAHEIDNAWFLDIAQVNRLSHISGYTFLPAAAPNYEQGLLNLRNPILKDRRVRQALQYGLQRDAMVRSVWHGTAKLIASDQVAPSFSFDPSIAPYPYDPVKAAQLLDAAGWKMGNDGRRHRNGQTLTLRYSTTSNSTYRAQDESIVLQDYQKLGIDLRIINYPSSTLFGSVFGKGDFDIAEWQNGMVYDPDSTIAPYFGSGAVPPAGSNYGRYSNPAYDTLIAQEQAITDPAKRKAIFSRMQRIMADDLPALWLYSPPTPSEYSNALHNYAPGPFSYETWNTWDWWKG